MFRRRITDADLERVRSEARSDATQNALLTQLQLAFQAHVVRCDEDKKNRDLQHEQNQKAISWVKGYIWMATGFWGAVMLGLRFLEVFHK